MNVLKFLKWLIGTTCAVTFAGAISTYFTGWRGPLPTSWVWSITSVIGGFIASSCFNAGFWKIVFVSFTWPVVIWFIASLTLGIGLALSKQKGV